MIKKCWAEKQFSIDRATLPVREARLFVDGFQ
jgi:hypothetical protein